MSVIFIGDRQVGKTTLAVELAKPSTNSAPLVTVIEPTYEELVERYYSDVPYYTEEGDKLSILESTATKERQVKDLKLQVKLPTGTKRIISLKWVDTPGELWENSHREPSKNPLEEWSELMKDIKTARGIILVLAPHRNRLDKQRCLQAPEPISLDEPRFLEYNAWVEQFDLWLDFLGKQVTTSQQVLICLNMADLFCDCDALANELPFDPARQDLKKIQDYLLTHYFQEVRTSIDRYNSLTRGNPLQVFVTTKENRILLESPWLYLARFIRN